MESKLPTPNTHPELFPEKALVIFSGGQDSTTCLKWALNRFPKVEAILFRYGQKHEIEISQARKITELLNVPLVEVDLSSLTMLASSALLQGDSRSVNETNIYGLPSSFVPGRNGIFIYNAFVYALKSNCTHLVTGVCQTDYSGYPDCRLEFIKNLEFVMNQGVFGDEKKYQKVAIETPLMFLTKAETFELANREMCLDLVLEHSHTCYNGLRDNKYPWGYGCGTCPACELRKKGWEEFIAKPLKP